MDMKGGFIKNLPKIYGLYTGGFAVFILIMAIAEQAGVSAKNIGVMFVAFTVLIYAFIGYLSRTVQVDAYMFVDCLCQFNAGFFYHINFFSYKVTHNYHCSSFN